MQTLSAGKAVRRRLETTVAMIATIGVFAFLFVVGAGVFG